jgi:hypothetical protein
MRRTVLYNWQCYKCRVNKYVYVYLRPRDLENWRFWTVHSEKLDNLRSCATSRARSIPGIDLRLHHCGKWGRSYCWLYYCAFNYLEMDLLYEPSSSGPGIGLARVFPPCWASRESYNTKAQTDRLYWRGNAHWICGCNRRLLDLRWSNTSLVSLANDTLPGSWLYRISSVPFVRRIKILP